METEAGFSEGNDSSPQYTRTRTIMDGNLGGALGLEAKVIAV